MKVKVKTTGEIVEVDLPYISMSNEIIYPEIGSTRYYTQDELDFDIEKEDIIVYWTRLEHQYAGMAMQGILSNPEVDLDYKSDECMPQAVAATAYNIAHSLVEELKEKEERK